MAERVGIRKVMKLCTMSVADPGGAGGPLPPVL